MTPSQAIKEIRMFVDLYNYGSEECKAAILAIENGEFDPKPVATKPAKVEKPNA